MFRAKGESTAGTIFHKISSQGDCCRGVVVQADLAGENLPFFTKPPALPASQTWLFQHMEKPHRI